MVDYVDITDDYFVAGDFDSRKRHIMTRTGASNPLAVCSGVTWRVGGGRSQEGQPMRAYRWQLGSRGSASFTVGALVLPDVPAPQRVTDCRI